MIRSSILAIITLITVAGIVTVSAQETTAPADQLSTNNGFSESVVVHYSVDKTALYPGDRVSYHLEIRTAPNVDILIEDLEAGKLELTGLEVVSFDQTQSSSDKGMVYNVHYGLTAYDVSRSLLSIGSQTIRYFEKRRGMQTVGATPSGEITVPPTQLILRSTLPAPLSQLRLRDAHYRDMVPGGMSWTGTAGLILILISGAPVALWVIAVVRNRVATLRKRRVPKTSNIKKITALENLEAVNANVLSERRNGYDLLEGTIRTYFSESGNIHANCLTASEFNRHVTGNDTGVAADEVVSVLEDCERARYGKSEHLPSVERFEAGVTTVRRLLLGH